MIIFEKCKCLFEVLDRSMITDIDNRTWIITKYHCRLCGHYKTIKVRFR